MTCTIHVVATERPMQREAAPLPVATALVREWLARHGFRSALAELDAAQPPCEATLTSRTDIVREMRLEQLLRRNRECSRPQRTVLEMLVASHVDAHDDDDDSDDDGSDDNDDDDDESRGGGLAAAALPPLPPCGPLRAPPPAPPPEPTLALPAGGPLDTAPRQRPLTRPKSARPGASRTPNVTPSTNMMTPTFSELPRKATTASATSDAPMPPPQAICLDGRRGEQLVVRPGDCSGGTCTLSDLVSCEVLLLDWSAQVPATTSAVQWPHPAQHGPAARSRPPAQFSTPPCSS